MAVEYGYLHDKIKVVLHLRYGIKRYTHAREETPLES